MNRIMFCSVSCLLISAGCRSTDSMTSWMTGSKTSAAMSADAGLPPPSQATDTATTATGQTNPPATDAAQQVEIGQSEVAAWYADQKPHHLVAAKMHFDAALQHEPNTPRAHHGLAIVADLQKDFVTAEKHYRLALAQSPNDSNILGDLGYSYLLQDRLAESIRFSQKAIDANSANRKATKHLADALARQGNSEQARAVYAKILPPEEIEKALAANSQTAPAMPSGDLAVEESLIDKIVPGKSAGQKLAEDIQQRQREYEKRMSQAMPPDTSRAERVATETQLSEADILKQKLAAIDNPAPAHSGPLMLDNRTGQLTRVPDSEMSSSWNGDSVMPASFPVEAMTPEERAPRRAASAAPPQPNSHVDGAVRPAFAANAAATPPGAATPGAERPWAGATGDNSTAPAGASQPTPWSGITTAAGTRNASDSALAQSRPDSRYGASPAPVQNAFGTHIQGSSVPPDLNSAAQFANGSTPAGMPGSPPGAMPSADAMPPTTAQHATLDDATKAAARMGMGLGPGSMFPVFASQSQVQMPGSNSYDQANVAPPKRDLPIDRPLPNLEQAYQPLAPSSTTPSYNPAGQLPATSSPMYNRDQYASPARYDTTTLKQSDIPQERWSAMESYEAQRWEAGKELNHAVQEVWDKGPINSAVSPTAGSVYSQPTSQPPLYNRDGLNAFQPPAWPNRPADQPQTAVQGSTTSAVAYPAQQTSYQPQSAPQGVVPPPYNGGQIPMPQQQPSPQPNANGLPTIRPAP